MRDAIGSTFMFRLIIIFIVFYVTFATIAVSYAKTFRIKNRIIDVIEQKEFEMGNNMNLIDDYVPSNYHIDSVKTKARRDCNKQIRDGDGGFFTNKGVCIVKSGDNYFVTAYIPIVMPVGLAKIAIPVRGKTRYYRNENSKKVIG